MKQLIILAALVLVSCNNNNFDDYREEFIGIYDCTKSNRGFDDDTFITELEVIVEIDSTNESSVIIDGTSFIIDENGDYEDGFNDNDFHTLSLADGKIRWEVNVYFPFGLALPCYIQGEKR